MQQLPIGDRPSPIASQSLADTYEHEKQFPLPSQYFPAVQSACVRQACSNLGPCVAVTSSSSGRSSRMKPSCTYDSH